MGNYTHKQTGPSPTASGLPADTPSEGLFSAYRNGHFFCELTNAGAPLDPRIDLLRQRLNALPLDDLRARAAQAEQELYISASPSPFIPTGTPLTVSCRLTLFPAS